jgi:mono/diheme cytochrome c family protein
MKKTFILLASFSLFALFAFVQIQDKRAVKEMNVYDLLLSLGDEPMKHTLSKPTEEQVRQGEDIVLLGKTEKDGKMSNFVSKFYTCTSCHNIAQEDPVITNFDPQARLEYVSKKGIPFLQGSTFWGMVNRETWYNDDYVIKYGDLVKPARNDLTEAVQLCAQVCSQGRKLEKWELDAVMAYLWSLQLKVSDLDLPDELVGKLQKSSSKDTSLVAELKKYYPLKSPATFVEPPSDKAKGYDGLVGNAENGKLLYDNSCQSCHKDGGVSRLILDNSKFTLNKLRRKIDKNSHYSLYEITRHGTHPIEGHKPYMPHYTLERMSHQQVEDLRAYVETGGK